MNTSTIAVNWHDENQPVYLACFQPSTNGKSQRLATGGGDNNVRIWKVNYKEGASLSTSIEYLSTLRKHTQAVNVVRFNKKGDVLATAGDDGLLLLWTLSDKIVQDFGHQDDFIKESWTVLQILHTNSEIYDLLWSPESKYIATGSMDNCVKIFDVITGQKVADISEHTHYVQGVSWDPLDKFVASLSADRSMHVYSLGKQINASAGSISPSVHNKISRIDVPCNPKDGLADIGATRSALIYHTESLQSFFRRLAFSPDGSLLLTPLGIHKRGESKEDDSFDINTVYVYLRSGLKQAPVCHLPTPNKPAVAIAFSPLLFKLDDRVSSSAFSLPYKMVFAIATQNAVVIYDTQNFQPLGVSSNLHYSTITDLAWDTDGQNLLVSSADGFCSCVNFQEGIFGSIYDPLQLVEVMVEQKGHLHVEAKEDKNDYPKSQAQVQQQAGPEPEIIDVESEVEESKPSQLDQPPVINNHIVTSAPLDQDQNHQAASNVQKYATNSFTQSPTSRPVDESNAAIKDLTSQLDSEIVSSESGLGAPSALSAKRVSTETWAPQRSAVDIVAQFQASAMGGFGGFGGQANSKKPKLE